MKKLLALLFCAFAVNQALAAVTLVNENKVNDVDVSYRFCQVSQDPIPKCTDVSATTVKAGDSHTASISAPPNMQSILIVSAVEKNSADQVIAQGNYEMGTSKSHCGYPLVEDQNNYNVAVSLSDMNGTSIIRCLANGY